MSGKSTLILRILADPGVLFDKVPNRIVYVYAAWQPDFDKMNGIEFVSSLDKVLEEDYFSSKDSNCLVLDDQMEEISNDARASRLFTKYIHHKNLTVFFLVQNMYRQGKSMRDVMLNCQYLFLFKNSRDFSQIQLLSRQLGLKHLPLAYERAIKVPYNFLLLDLHPKTPQGFQIQSDLFSYRKIYRQK